MHNELHSLCNILRVFVLTFTIQKGDEVHRALSAVKLIASDAGGVTRGVVASGIAERPFLAAASCLCV